MDFSIAESLRFAALGLAQKELVAELVYFDIRNRRIRSYNGVIAANAPIDIDISARPKGQVFMKAIASCMGTKSPLAMSTTKSGKIGIKTDKMSVNVDCLPQEGEFVFPDTEGARFPVGVELYDAIVAVAPYISKDASRKWSLGVRLEGQSAFATNNIILIERWHGYTLPQEVTLPAPFVREVVRLGVPPDSMAVTQNAVTFFYGDGWLRTQLVEDKWPSEQIAKIMESATSGDANPVPLPDNFEWALDKLAYFTDERDRLYFRNGVIATHATDLEGARVACHVAEDGLFNASQLRALAGIATAVDFAAYPAPCPFIGHLARGVIVGMRA